MKEKRQWFPGKDFQIQKGDILGRRETAQEFQLLIKNIMAKNDEIMLQNGGKIDESQNSEKNNVT